MLAMFVRGESAFLPACLSVGAVGSEGLHQFNYAEQDSDVGSNPKGGGGTERQIALGKSCLLQEC